MNSQPMIAVHDVAASRTWYEQVLGATSVHGGDSYDRIADEGRILIQLHKWDADDHPHMGDSTSRPYGNGALLWFTTDAFDEAMKRVQGMRADILQDAHVNPMAKHRECWLRDPDGYVVVLASPHGDVG